MFVLEVLAIFLAVLIEALSANNSDSTIKFPLRKLSSLSGPFNQILNKQTTFNSNPQINSLTRLNPTIHISESSNHTFISTKRNINLVSTHQRRHRQDIHESVDKYCRRQDKEKVCRGNSRLYRVHGCLVSVASSERCDVWR
jgi:hypothetical protein